jgi:hypothetical protein
LGLLLGILLIIFVAVFYWVPFFGEVFVALHKPDPPKRTNGFYRPHRRRSSGSWSPSVSAPSTVLLAGKELHKLAAQEISVQPEKAKQVLPDFSRTTECKCRCGKTFWCPPSAFWAGTVCADCDPFEEAVRKFWKRYEAGALERGHAFDISFVRFREIITQNCHYTGVEPNQKVRVAGKTFLFNGVDRMDSAQGYSDSNCVPCCSAANFAKRTMAYQDFVAFLDATAKFRLDKTSQTVVESTSELL